MKRFTPGLIVLLILVGSAAVAVPYARSVQAESAALRADLDAFKASAPWSPASTGPECVGYGMDFGANCSGVRQACDAAVPDLVRQCAEQAELSAWCAEQGSAVHTTGFGFHDCEARVEGLERGDARRPKKHCASGWRALARICAAP